MVGSSSAEVISAIPRRFPRIVRDPVIVGGEPTVQGTRVPVRSIVVLHQLYGDTERLRRAFPRLDSDDIREALDFYSAHREEVDTLIAENEDNGAA